MIKIICAVLLSAVVVISLSGCGSKDEATRSDHPTSEQSTSEHPEHPK